METRAIADRASLHCDPALLRSFEEELDPLAPEAGSLGAKVLGYGEMSTVFAIDTPDTQNLCFKRMPMFASVDEVESYAALYNSFLDLLEGPIGVRTVPSRLVEVGRHRGSIVVYIVQKKLAPDCVVQRLLGGMEESALIALLRSALTEAEKVYQFNDAQAGVTALAIDGQLSNWALRTPGDRALLERGETVGLDYLDTSTPLLRQEGRERLDTELFLRAAPPFLKPLLRRFAVRETVERYYHRRSVAIDMIANLYKEQRGEAVPALVAEANDFFASHAPDTEPLTMEDVQAYYRNDANIWRLYLGARKIDRAGRRLLGRPYPYILPAKVVR